MSDLPPYILLADLARETGTPYWRALRDYDAGRYDCRRVRLLGQRVVEIDEAEAVKARMQELKRQRGLICV